METAPGTHWIKDWLLCVLPGIECQLPSRPAHNLVTMLAESSQSLAHVHST
jgi:hypothetical protein